MLGSRSTAGRGIRSVRSFSRASPRFRTLALAFGSSLGFDCCNFYADINFDLLIDMREQCVPNSLGKHTGIQKNFA